MSQLPLLKLPPEIVEMILDKVISRGETAIIRTSHRIHDLSATLAVHATETKDGLEVLRTFRVLPTVKKHRHFILHIALDVYSLEHYPQIRRPIREEVFNDIMDMNRGKSCGVIFYTTRRPEILRSLEILEILRSFNYFETLAIEMIRAGYNLLHNRPARPSGYPAPLGSGWGSQLYRTMHGPMYKVVEEELSPSLGPGLLQNGEVEGGEYLRFYPRMNSAATTALQEPTNQRQELRELTESSSSEDSSNTS